MQGTELVTVGEVARLARVSAETIRRLIDAGTIPALRTTGGMRLVERAAAVAFAERRAQRHDERGAHGEPAG
jgi:excisionase family DNA binding protein